MSLKPKKPTIADVARHAGVSIATVSRVLNGTVPVQPEKAERVMLAMDELKFVPRHAAQVLASKKTNTIGLLLPEISGAFFQPMLKGIEGAAQAIRPVGKEHGERQDRQRLHLLRADAILHVQ